MESTALEANLLTDSVFTVSLGSEETRCALPRLYHLLSQDRVSSFTHLPSHQKHGWHAFLAQLGAVALEDWSSSPTQTPQSPTEWKEALTEGKWTEEVPPSAWRLYSPDLQSPAFMQPPVPGGSLEGFKPIEVHDQDVPVLTKMIGQKRWHATRPEHWIYTLVNLQTQSFFYGKGHYPTSRMNGGAAARPFFSLTPSLRLGPWIMSDIEALRRHRSEIESRYGYDSDVTPLIWTLPWDGESSIDLTDLHPLYVDCARRIRQGTSSWLKKGTSTSRVTGDENGKTGDPWAPVDTEDGKVLNPTPQTLEYRQLADILFADRYRLPITFRPEVEGHVVCRAIAGGQGKRGRQMQRVVPFSTTARKSEVTREARSRVEQAEEGATILSHALLEMLSPSSGQVNGSPESLPRRSDLPKRHQNGLSEHLQNFHEAIDQRFFDRLYEADEFSGEERSAFWETILVEAARIHFRNGTRLCPSSDRWKRLARGEHTLEGRLRSSFPHARQFNDDEEDDEDIPERTITGRLWEAYQKLPPARQSEARDGASRDLLKRLLKEAGEEDIWYGNLPKWRVLVRCMAIAGHGSTPFGRALSRAGLPPLRLQRLLEKDITSSPLPRLVARFLSSSGISTTRWDTLRKLLFYKGRWAATIRLQVAREFYDSSSFFDGNPSSFSGTVSPAAPPPETLPPETLAPDSFASSPP